MNKLILTALLWCTIMLNTTLAQTTLFDTYPWLTDLVQPDDCSIASVELYEQGIFHFLLVTDANQTQRLYFEDGTFYCQNSPGYNCVRIYNLGKLVDIWACGDGETTCLINITNTQCRSVRIYDTEDNLLTTIGSNFPLPPPNYVAPRWTDPRPLMESETRTYIFKENNLVLGQQTVSCDQPNISTVSAYFSGCSDALGIDQFKNIGCRTLTAYNTNSQLLFTLEPGDSTYKVQSFPFTIYIFLAGSDTISIGRTGPINSRGCDAPNAIPFDFQAYNAIYRICKGETLTIPNPYRDVQCPLSDECLNTPVICENFPFRQQAEWTSSTGEIVTTVTPRPSESFVTFAPTFTTTYLGISPYYRCGIGPLGPRGEVLNYLVIVEEAEDCQAQSVIARPTNFEITACVGEQISVPVPHHAFCPEGLLTENNNIAELIAINGNVMELKILGSGRLDYTPTTTNVQVGDPGINQVRINVSCPSATYQYNIQISEGCETPPEQNNAIFSDFPWLTDLINPATCSTESIAIYQQGVYQYLLVTDATGNSTLYNQDGLFYCQNANNFDCVTAYGFNAPTTVWECGAVILPPTTPNCSNNSGTIFYEDCDDGQEFYFIKTADGQIFDPYFADDYQPINNQLLSFDFVDADFNTPCSIAEKAISITCYELVETPLFSKYPFLANLVDPDNCQIARIEEYSFGSYAYIHVNMGNGNSTLYFGDGTFYCQDAANYNCRDAYDLTSPTATWTCPNLSNPATTDRANFNSNNNDLIAFPNPTNGQLFVDIPALDKSVNQLQIIDIMGRLVEPINIPANNNAQRIALDLTTYQNGVYYLKFGRSFKKIVKQGLE